MSSPKNLEAAILFAIKNNPAMAKSIATLIAKICKGELKKKFASDRIECRQIIKKNKANAAEKIW